MARVIVQSGIVDLSYACMVLQEPRDLHRVLFMLPHAQGERLYPSQREKTIKGRRRRAGGILRELEPLIKRGFLQTDGSADDVRVSRQVFCRRVKDEIGTELEGPLKNRRREGVVDQTEGAMVMGD